MAKIRFMKTGYETNVLLRNIAKHNVRDPYYPIIHGVACIGNTSNTTGKNPRDLKLLFKHWISMINRCYDNNDISNYKDIGITVCDRWLCFENFENDAKYLPGYEDMINNPNVKYHIDKDYLQQGVPANQKIYSPETCIWTTAYFNETQAIIDNKHKCINQYYCVNALPNGNHRVRIFNRFTKQPQECGVYTNEIAAANIANFYNKNYGNPYLINNVPYMNIGDCLQYRTYKAGRSPVDMIKIIDKNK